MINSKKSIYMMNRYYGNTDVKIDEAAAKFIKNGGIIKSLYETGEKMKIKTGEHSFKKFDKKELIDLCRKFRQTVKTLD